METPFVYTHSFDAGWHRSKAAGNYKLSDLPCFFFSIREKELQQHKGFCIPIRWFQTESGFFTFGRVCFAENEKESMTNEREIYVLVNDQTRNAISIMCGAIDDPEGVLALHTERGVFYYETYLGCKVIETLMTRGISSLDDHTSEYLDTNNRCYYSNARNTAVISCSK